MIIVACTIATLHAGIEGGKPSFTTKIQRTTRRRDDQSLHFEAQDIWQGQDWKSPDTCHQASPFRYVYTQIIDSSCTQHKLLRRSGIKSGPSKGLSSSPCAASGNHNPKISFPFFITPFASLSSVLGDLDRLFDLCRLLWVS